MYLTYAEYLEYGGEMDESTFTQAEFKCSKVIDSLTAERVKSMEDVPEAVKRCEFELIKQEQLFYDSMNEVLARASHGGGTSMVASFSTDGYSESYATGTGNTGEYMQVLRSKTDEIQKQIISDFLAYECDDNGVRLLYRGVYR